MDTKTIQEISMVVGALGALAIAIGALVMVVAGRSYSGPTAVQRKREKWLTLIGALLILVAFAGLFAVTVRR